MDVVVKVDGLSTWVGADNARDDDCWCDRFDELSMDGSNDSNDGSVEDDSDDSKVVDSDNIIDFRVVEWMCWGLFVRGITSGSWHWS